MDEIQEILALERELECRPEMGSTCDCPAADGFICESNQCEWSYVNEEPSDDFCSTLEASGWESAEQYECGLGPNGVEMCHWWIEFGGGSFFWSYSDIGESGEYKCHQNWITSFAANGREYQGMIHNPEELDWDGVLYTRAW